MQAVNYPQIQARVKDVIQNTLSGSTVVVTNLANTAITTVGAFSNGLAKNIDNRQNPTWTTGETARFCYVPGIDFVNNTTNPPTISTPQVGGIVSWTYAGTSYKKVISTVGIEMVVPGVPLIFILGVE